MKSVKVDSLQPLLVDAPNYQRFAGRYYLTGIVTKQDSHGQPLKSLTLSDGSGDLRVFCNNPELMQEQLSQNSIVHIEAALLQKHGSAYYRCKNLMPVSDESLLNGDLSVLPLSLCPFPEAFYALIVFVSRISSPILRKFVRQVLLQPQVGVRFLQCPASLKYHHNYPGGLIKHSMEVAWDIAGVRDFSDIERDIAVVAAILHDVGKTQTLTPDVTRTAIGRLVDHCQLTLEICAKPLRELETAAPGLAHQLRHAWTCYSPNARFGFKAKTRVAQYLQRADKHSAEKQLGNITLPAFKNANDIMRQYASN